MGLRHMSVHAPTCVFGAYAQIINVLFKRYFHLLYQSLSNLVEALALAGGLSRVGGCDLLVALVLQDRAPGSECRRSPEASVGMGWCGILLWTLLHVNSD